MKIPSTRASAQSRMQALAQAGDWQAARQFARAVLRRWPDDAAGHELAAIASRSLGQAAEAARYYKRLCALQPTVGGLQNEYATALLEAGQVDAAEAVVTQRLKSAPEDARAVFVLACVHEARKAWPTAVGLYRLATTLAPDFADAWFNLGTALEASGDFPAAEAALQRALALDPQSSRARVALSAVALELQRPDEALRWADAALALIPGFDNALVARGCALRDLGRPNEAEQALRQVLASASKRRFRAALNLITLLAAAARLDEAEQCASLLLSLPLDVDDGAYYRGVERLRRGDLPGGWADYEARFKLRHAQPGFHAPAELPAWQGGSLAGARILAVPEQGFGDLIQFCRFVPRLRALGASRIGIACPAPLRRLLASLAGVDDLVSVDSPVTADEWDCWVPVMSLPHFLKVSLEAVGSPPYLQAPEALVDAWRSRLGRPAIGLVWRGNPGFRNDANRSLPGPRAYAPLAACTNAHWVNLQKDATSAELAEAADAGLPLLDAAPELSDFMASAALVAALDLVITVDTAVAHLAGAIGTPCRVLLPAIGCDWRWLQARTDSPWYGQDFRLLRQQQPGDWSAVMAELRHELAGDKAA